MTEKTEGRSYEQVVADVADVTRLVGREWTEFFEPNTIDRVKQILEEGFAEIAVGSKMYATGGIVLQRDDDMGHTDIMVVIGTRWDEQEEGPEWT